MPCVGLVAEVAIIAEAVVGVIAVIPAAVVAVTAANTTVVTITNTVAATVIIVTATVMVIGAAVFGSPPASSAMAAPAIARGSTTTTTAVGYMNANKQRNVRLVPQAAIPTLGTSGIHAARIMLHVRSGSKADLGPC